MAIGFDVYNKNEKKQSMTSKVGNFLMHNKATPLGLLNVGSTRARFKKTVRKSISEYKSRRPSYG